MSHIILPNRQVVRKENETEFLRREIGKLKNLLIDQENTHQARLLTMNRELQKIDKIMVAAFNRIEAYEAKLEELDINPKDLCKS